MNGGSRGNEGRLETGELQDVGGARFVGEGKAGGEKVSTGELVQLSAPDLSSDLIVGLVGGVL